MTSHSHFIQPRGFTPLPPVLNHIFLSQKTKRGRDENVFVSIAADGLEDFMVNRRVTVKRHM